MSLLPPQVSSLATSLATLLVLSARTCTYLCLKFRNVYTVGPTPFLLPCSHLLCFVQTQLEEISLLEWSLIQARDENSEKEEGGVIWLPFATLAVLHNGARGVAFHHSLFTGIPWMTTVN